MKQQMRNSAREAVRRVAPGAWNAVEDVARLRGEFAELRQRVQELEDDVQENRQLNRRVAELTDIVQELLIPIANRDDAAVQELLDRQRELF